jgi:hypothetical protein
MPTTPKRLAGSFALEIDGVDVGFVSSVTGGEAFARSIETPSPSGFVEKRPGEIEYEPIVLELDNAVGPAFWERVTRFLEGSQASMSGAISFLDMDSIERARLEWTDGLITEIGFPAADAGSKDPAHLRVTIQAESTRRQPGSGKRVPGGISTRRQRWLAANFRFTIAGLENAMKRVDRVESLVLRRPVTRTPKALVQGSLDVPDVVFSVAAIDAAQFSEWFDDFIVKGNSTADKERTGSLEWLDATLKGALIGVGMRGLGILRVSEQEANAGTEAIPRVTVQLYCEAMELSPAPK